MTLYKLNFSSKNYIGFWKTYYETKEQISIEVMFSNISFYYINNKLEIYLLKKYKT